MKENIMNLFILLSSLMMGCNNSGAENNPSKSNEKNNASQAHLPVETKKQVMIPKKDVAVIKKVARQKNKEIELQKPEVKALDLSLPIGINQPIPMDNTSKQNKANYLPNLFKNEESSVDLEGSLIRKHEEEQDKYKAADVVGVELNLSN
jgi:hypothetical protein